MPRRKPEPVVIYGARITTLADLSQACDDMKASAARRTMSPSEVLIKAYVKLVEDADTGLTIEVQDESEL